MHFEDITAETSDLRTRPVIYPERMKAIHKHKLELIHHKYMVEEVIPAFDNQPLRKSIYYSMMRDYREQPDYPLWEDCPGCQAPTVKCSFCKKAHKDMLMPPTTSELSWLMPCVRCEMRVEPLPKCPTWTPGHYLFKGLNLPSIRLYNSPEFNEHKAFLFEDVTASMEDKRSYINQMPLLCTEFMCTHLTFATLMAMNDNGTMWDIAQKAALKHREMAIEVFGKDQSEKVISAYYEYFCEIVDQEYILNYTPPPEEFRD